VYELRVTASKCGKNKWADNLGEISSAERIIISEFTLTSACGEIVTFLAQASSPKSDWGRRCFKVPKGIGEALSTPKRPQMKIRS